jgi:hypothetical protein
VYAKVEQIAMAAAKLIIRQPRRATVLFRREDNSFFFFTFFDDEGYPLVSDVVWVSSFDIFDNPNVAILPIAFLKRVLNRNENCVRRLSEDNDAIFG